MNVAKFLYPNLKTDEYKSLHHVVKFNILSEIIVDRLKFQGDYLRVCTRIFYYWLEHHDVTLLNIQKRRYLENGEVFFPEASLRDLRTHATRLKNAHTLRLKNIANKNRKNEGKKGVYVLLDSEYQNKLEIVLKGNKMTLNALFKQFIDAQSV